VASPWILFIWPSGEVFPCIEWAGTKGWAIGDLRKDSLAAILASQRRLDVHSWINTQKVCSACPPVCAPHESNIVFNGLLDLAKRTSNQDAISAVAAVAQEEGIPPHVEFM
jgi:radical SAM protein with 4Fe4S-binding SPASM domain